MAEPTSPTSLAHLGAPPARGGLPGVSTAVQGGDGAGAGGRAPSRRRLLVAVALTSLLALTCWLQWRGLRSEQSSLVIQRQSLAAMQADASRIMALQQVPRKAVERRKPNDELLGQIESALQSSGVPVNLWQDSVPQAPHRLPESPYLRFGTRLYFESMRLDQLVHFAWTLLDQQPSLAVSSLHLTKPSRDTGERWDAELSISYLVYAPDS